MWNSGDIASTNLINSRLEVFNTLIKQGITSNTTQGTKRFPSITIMDYFSVMAPRSTGNHRNDCAIKGDSAEHFGETPRFVAIQMLAREIDRRDGYKIMKKRLAQQQKWLLEK